MSWEHTSRFSLAKWSSRNISPPPPPPPPPPHVPNANKLSDIGRPNKLGKQLRIEVALVALVGTKYDYHHAATSRIIPMI